MTATGGTPYTNSLVGGMRNDVPFPGEWEVDEFKPYPHCSLTEITETDNIITFRFTNTATSLESPTTETILLDGIWYNILGQPIDIHTHHGIAISKQGKVFVR